MNAELKTFVDSLGLSYSATFVPQSQSRNADEKHKSLNWRVTIRSPRAAGNMITADYMQGIGHVPKDPQVAAEHKGANRNCIMIDDYARKCAETGKYGMWNGKPIPPPPLVDVLHCLVLDGEAYDYSFEEWAREFEYDTDSRKALATWETCRDHGLKLRRMLSAEQLEKLRELFQDY